jgi:hypothetical protein
MCEDQFGFYSFHLIYDGNYSVEQTASKPESKLPLQLP